LSHHTLACFPLCDHPPSLSVAHPLFLPHKGLASTLGLLRRAPHLVAGLAAGKDDRLDECGSADEEERRAAMGAALHDRFLAQLKLHRPDALAAAETELRRPKSLWDRMTATAGGSNGGGDDGGAVVAAAAGGGDAVKPSASKKGKMTSSFSFNFGM